jgi:hypothetical protein
MEQAAHRVAGLLRRLVRHLISANPGAPKAPTLSARCFSLAVSAEVDSTLVPAKAGPANRANAASTSPSIGRERRARLPLTRSLEAYVAEPVVLELFGLIADSRPDLLNDSFVSGIIIPKQAKP